MSNDYIIKFTDPAKVTSSFAVKPYTFDGHLSPADPALYTNVDTGVHAVNANTSLVFLGKGMPDYGEAVQNNFVYLLENFANSVPPLEPVEGQIWYNNVDGTLTKGLYVYNLTTSSWDKLVIQTSAGVTGDIDMGNLYQVINLAAPTNPQDAATKKYVDDVHGVLTDYTLHLTASQNTFLDGITVSFAEVNYLSGVTSLVQPQIDGKVSKTGDTMTGPLSMGTNRITTLADPVNNDDAATKQYVDAVAGGGAADGVVNSGALDPITGILSLGRTIGGPVVVTGNFAPFSHTQADSTVTHDVASPINQSFLVSLATTYGTYPAPPVYNALTYVDQAVYDLQRPVHRQLIVSTGSTAITLRNDMTYNVNEHKLHVFMNGVKQYASEHGSSVVAFYRPIIGLTSDTGLAASTAYSFTITVDALPPQVITITTPATTPYTFYELLLDIDSALTTAFGLPLPVVVNYEQYLDRMELIFTSVLSGTGSSVTLSFAVGELFQSITSTTTLAPTNTAVTVDYAYAEVGIPGEPSTQLTLNTAPAVGAVFEILLI